MYLKIVGILLFLGLPSAVFAQDSLSFQVRCAAVLGGLTASYVGETPLGNAYNLYAIRYGRDWVLLIDDHNEISCFLEKKQAHNNTLRTSNVFTASVCKLIQSAMLKKYKKKEKKLRDITLKSYYTLTKKGKKTLDGLWILETNSKRKGRFSGGAGIIFTPLVGLFQKKESALKKQLQDYEKILTNYEKKMKEMESKLLDFEEKAKILDGYKKRIKELQEIIEKSKKIILKK